MRSKRRIILLAVLAGALFVWTVHAETTKTVSDSGTTVVVTDNNDEYGQEVSKLVKNQEERYAAEQKNGMGSPGASRLLVKGKKAVDLEVYSPETIVEGPDYHYTCQFYTVEEAENAMAELNASDDILYAEQDGVVMLDDSVEEKSLFERIISGIQSFFANLFR